MKQNILLVLLINSLFVLSGKSQIERPHLLVSNNDKASIQAKIHDQSWAKTISDRLSVEVTPYVDRHVSDPRWILSRYQMNRVPGKRYTRVISDEGGLKVIRYEGDAPVPTVRVGSHIRVPVTASGASYIKPSIEDLVPDDTSRLMFLFNTETRKKEWIDPQAFTGDINSDINDLAMEASILYWLKGEEKYARFAADILDQWAKGAYYMEPIIGPCRTGYLNMQTLGDAESRGLLIAYDFVHDFMKINGYDLKYYQPVFEKIASTLAFRGFYNNNWYAAESSTLVFASLSLEDKSKRDYYLQYYLSKDTINGACGQLGLPTTVEKWLTPDGHWKEPGGYHNYPVGNLLIAAYSLEKNGYDIFRKFPALFRASYAMLKYSFPNLTVSAFGDTGRASQSPESLELGLVAAIKYNQPELPEMLASMRKLIEGGKYNRENSGYLGLLCYAPDLPSMQSTYSWPRSSTLDFAKYFLQRNGMDPTYGLMYGVQGASYNHNHNNGMSIELYGMGTVMGIDAGTGATYEHPLHQTYYSQWAAHNTVTAAGSSASVPWSGGASRKNIGAIELASMEPMADKPAVSSNVSFTDTRYFDKSTNTNQSRTLAIVRTSDKSGYYVDIYRSDNSERNDYVYHNIGDELVLMDAKRNEIQLTPAEYPIVGKDYPGFRYFSEVKKVEDNSDNIIALFSAKNEESKPVFMQTLVHGKTGRTYFTAKSLHTKTAGRQYASTDPPVFTMMDKSESASTPFIAVFEPFGGSKDGYTVDRIEAEKRTDGKEFTSLTVYNRDKSRQVILQALDPKKSYSSGKGSFAGSFGVISLTGENVKSLYLGEGNQLTFRNYSLRTKTPGSVNLDFTGNEIKVSCNQETEIGLPAIMLKGAILNYDSKSTNLTVKQAGEMAIFTVPQILDGTVILSTGDLSKQNESWTASKTTVEKLSAGRKEFNYYEEKVPSFTLPDPLKMNNGKMVRNPADWNKERREEILEVFRNNVFGRVPATAYKETFRIVNTDAGAMDGAATLKQVVITITSEGKTLDINLSLFTPNRIKKPVPAFLLINNRGSVVADPLRKTKSEFWPAEEVIARGYAIAVFNNSDVDADNFDNFKDGIHAVLDRGARKGDSWGTIAAWAWGASRCMDYLVSDKNLDAGKIAVVGHSRGGKTALWAGAEDTRFAMVVSNESGCGGAALAQRKYGETVKRINESFPHWFCTNYRNYNDREDEMPFDMHWLLSLVAPRPLYVACASDDLWGDPKGSYLALYNAVPVFNLLGKRSDIPETMPPLEKPLISGQVAYHIREGEHNMLLSDWNRFMDFADKCFRNK